ncbi:hypothetical protein [uncultured Sunxiuqinia sp.]|uniref:hypothetical protein n=1 Tax=Sunxiuqinia rutila TaxID=1397841 RepID=UPI00260558D5|nr:hypothetical protein [uncultured Sunxiuqinia sp.]
MVIIPNCIMYIPKGIAFLPMGIEAIPLGRRIKKQGTALLPLIFDRKDKETKAVSGFDGIKSRLTGRKRQENRD